MLRGLQIPPDLVPAAFRDLVDAELVEARRRALASLPLPILEHRRTGSRWGADQAQTVRRCQGRCVECGVEWDDETAGCSRCVSRHAMRRLANARSLDAAA